MRKRGIDAVLVGKFDRFERSTKELINAFEEFNKKEIGASKDRELLEFHLKENSSRLEQSQTATINLLNFAHHAKERFINGSMEDKKMTEPWEHANAKSTGSHFFIF